MAINRSTGSQKFLQEIQGLYKQGHRRDAIELLDDWLREHPEDAEALLLRAELCLEIRGDAKFIGEMAATYQTNPRPSEREQAVIEGAISWAEESLLRVRKELGYPDYDDALEYLERAKALTPWDASIHLAIATILYDHFTDGNDRQKREDEALALFSTLAGVGIIRVRERGDRSKSQGRLIQALRDALIDARSLSEVGSETWRKATSLLISFHLAQGDYQAAIALIQQEVTEASSEVQEWLAEIREGIAHQAFATAVERARQWMRIGDMSSAAALIEQILLVAPDSSSGWFALADWLYLQEDRQEDALAVYRWLANWEEEKKKQAPDIHAPDIHEGLFLQLRSDQTTCRRCHRPLAMTARQCRVCGKEVLRENLLSDLYHLERLEPPLAARVGQIAVLEKLGRMPEALDLLRETLPRISGEYPAYDRLVDLLGRLRSEREEHAYEESLSEAIELCRKGKLGRARRLLTGLMGNPGADDRVLAWFTLTLGNGRPLPDEMRDIVRRATRVSADIWTQAPITRRHRLMRTLLTSGWLDEARSLLDVLYTERESTSQKVRGFAAQCRAAITARCDRLAAEARHRLETDRPDEALRLTGEALSLEPTHLASWLVRGEAYLANEAPYQAAHAFQTLLEYEVGGEMRSAATLGLARACVALENFQRALEVLTLLPKDHPDARHLRTTLERRWENRPAICVTRLEEDVSTCTLRRTRLETPLYQATFGIEVTAVARWQSEDRISIPREEIFRAGGEFVAMLGGLADVPGDPAFELRLVARPDPEVPLRGRLTIALLCRVVHHIPEGAERLALELWDRLRARLPLAEQYLYQYVPVYDETKLEWLLEPFEVRSGVEVLRREGREDGAYVVEPFTVSGTTLQTLCTAMLQSTEPVLLSIYLKPVTVSPEEHEALRRNFDRLRRVRLPEDPEEEHHPGLGTSIDGKSHILILPDGRRTALVEHFDQIRQALERQAFVMRLSIAYADPGDRMLPHTLASELLGSGGRYQVVETSSPESLEILRRNLRHLTVERSFPTCAPEDLPHLRCLVSGMEATWIFRLPMPDVEGVPGVPLIKLKAVPPLQLPAEGLILGESVAMIGGSRREIRLRQMDRRRHLYIVGKTGVGKSTLLEVMALQDIEAGHGVAVLDPHGDLVESILSHMPLERVDDVIVFDPSDEERPIGLNFLEAETDSQRHRIVTEFIQMLVRMYDPHQQGIVGPRFQHNVRNAMLTVMLTHPGATLIEVVRALTDIKYVKALLPKIRDPLVRNYWEKQIAQTADYHKSEILDYIVSKFNRFVGDQLVRNIVGQSKSTLDFRAAMDERRILLVNLSKGKIGPESATFLGLLLLQSLLIAVLSRADQASREREDFCIYVDEFQTFATESFAAMLSEGRKYGLCLVMANQYLNQLPPDLQRAVFGNVGTLVAFQVGVQDAALLAQEFYPVFSEGDLMNIPRHTAAVRLLVDGVSTRPFAMKTRLSHRLPDLELAHRIKERSRQRYGRDVGAVTREIEQRISMFGN